MRKEPELRFPEFSGEWVEKRLGEIAKFFKGKGISKSDIDENGRYKCIRYGELFTTYKEIIRDIYSKTNECENMVISEGNETLMPTSDVTPNGLATASALNEKGVIIGGDILIIKSNKIINNFLSYYIKSHKKQIMRLVTGVTVYHIYANDMKNFKIILPPTLAEQEKIASFLSAVDKKIDLQEQKIEQLEKYKKALLQKLFATKEKKEPELRFPEFSGEWVEKRLGDIANIYQPKTISQKEMKKSGFPVFGANGLIGYYDKYNHLTWQILITCRGSTSGTVSKSLPKSWITGNAMVVNADNYLDTIDKIFLFYTLLNYNYGRIIEGSGQPQITRQPLMKIKILIPPTLAEQEKIASFLSSIDEKIEIEKEKLEKIKEYKKALLQKMFV